MGPADGSLWEKTQSSFHGTSRKLALDRRGGPGQVADAALPKNGCKETISGHTSSGSLSVLGMTWPLSLSGVTTSRERKPAPEEFRSFKRCLRTLENRGK